jgi:hypothetical protein
MPKYQSSLVEGSFTSEYYKSPKNHEVIFIGDCEVYANFNPMVLYEEYGISSYVRGNSQQMIWQSYYLLEETLKYEIPKVVVLNVNSLRYDKSSDKRSEAYNRLLIDRMKWSDTKIKLIKESMLDKETFISYLIPILRYHSRYNDLTKEDIKYLFKRKNVTYNGFLVNKEVRPLDNLPTMRNKTDYSFDKENIEWLDKILELCKKNNIELILVKAPSVYPYWYSGYDEEMVTYSKKNNINYYNLVDKASEIGIDYSTDTYDGGLHLNLAGSIKNSIYFGKILKETIDLKDFNGDNYYEELLKTYREEVK